MKSKQYLILLLLLLSMLNCYAQRDPLKWPFDKYSIWNVPIHNNAVYVPASVQPASNFEADEDVIIMTPNEPPMNVETNYTDWSAGGNARCDDEGPTLFSAPIPTSFIYSPQTWTGNTPNAGAAILLTDGRIKQTQPFAKCSNTLATSHYVWNENDCVLTGECIQGAHGGSHLSAIGGALRYGELSAGEIRHVLKLNLWGKENYYAGNGGFRWPATAADGGYNDPAGFNYYGGSNTEMRIGALLALHKDLNLSSLSNNSLGLETQAGLIIARALQTYGGYTVDNTGWDTYAIITEHGTQGKVRDEFQSLYGYSMNVYGGLSSSAWARDLNRIFTNLYVISNNIEGNTGGGPTTDSNRRAPFACDIGEQGTGNMCPTTQVAVTGVSVSPSTAIVYQGGTKQLSANVTPTNATNRNVTWSSANASIASVNSSGLVTAIAPGSVSITATTVDGGFSSSAQITVRAETNLPQSGDVIVLRAQANSRYVTASTTGIAQLFAEKSSAASTEQFVVQDAGSGGFYLQWVGNNRFVQANQGDGSKLQAISTTAGAADKLVFELQSDGSIALKYSISNRYVTASRSKGKFPLVASASTVSVNERFNWSRISTAASQNTTTLYLESSLGNEGDADIEAYPVPAEKTLTLVLKDFAQPTVNISTISGRSVYSQVHERQQITIDVSDFAPGLYVIRAHDKTKQRIRKILIK
jgi:hypothetical protein